ncbi:uncharacterized protein K452DRAFT_358543 [Aplosporella prunicola CBS 121167]|uniref:Uncharacterized protein n=1 Tax=Aplosporella prunicola CBS 121167 TaxID=1176127 RepID=A0A6A6BD00_9PEZI|nr:uncharacterized protein K452DRAFT_358543 [Aplosporella prunicola CBS 121167]KAF2142082.1 hypothetical protein K452DRAFT_358543 [Aplosporella prunicola CBS 121167]
MAKRKRDTPADGPAAKAKKQSPTTASTSTLQIITGSYERVLHGITASLDPGAIAAPAEDGSAVKWADTFLFNAHASAIRCLALSPPSDSTDPHSQKVILASGSTDERINLYHLSTAPPPINAGPSIPTLTGTTITQNPRNKELGALMHHSSNVSALHFPSRAKLFSGADDNTVAISRTRDWTVLSTIKAPIPKAMGRPSGDTAAPGEVPAGINDFAVHPSQKLMISVSKGEKCMRLWNVMTGKKASVLNFERDLLAAVGEGKFSSGEGRRLEWNPEGDEWVVTFERGFVVYGMDSKPKAQTLPRPLTKIHQVHYVPSLGEGNDVLAVSTEDGRILFYSTQETVPAAKGDIPNCKLLAQLGGAAGGVLGRIKDFEILPIPSESDSELATAFWIITGSSDGSVRLWKLSTAELSADDDAKPASKKKQKEKEDGNAAAVPATAQAAKQVGALIGWYQTNNRITCLKAFIMTGTPEDMSMAEAEEEDSAGSSSDDDDSDSE